MENTDQKWMRMALQEAEKARALGEVPVGAVLVGPRGLISKGHNLREKNSTPLGHAELIALHRGAKARQKWRMEDCTLYVTLEPCVMCAGALVQARLGRLVYGAKDDKAGAVDSHLHLCQQSFLNHQVKVVSGVLAAECSHLMSNFFSSLRDTKKSTAIDRHVTAVIVFHENKVLAFRGVDPTTQVAQYFLPGGKIEDHESQEESAMRETLEETGYRVQLIPGSHFFREYLYDWDGKTYRRRTEFFCAVLDEAWHPPQKQEDAAYNQGPEWIDIADIPKVFNYHPAILMSLQKATKIWRRWKSQQPKK